MRFLYIIFFDIYCAKELLNAKTHLQLTAVNDGGLDGGADSTSGGASLLNGHDGVQGLLVSDLAEDNVLAVQPLSLDGGDEELRAVAVLRKGNC